MFEWREGVAMTTAHGPVVGRRRLRSALRRARESAGLTQEQVSDRMDWSLSKLIRIEAGTVGVSTNDVRALLDLYGITEPDTVQDMLELARLSRQRPWWTGFRDRFPAPVFSYIGLEAETSSLHYFQPRLVPTLLQTPEYARAVLREGMASEPAGSDIDELIKIRLLRQQEVLGRERPPEVRVLLDEAVIRRRVGRPQVMREQLLHLVSLTREQPVSVRVLTFDAGPYPAMYGPFVLLEFPDPVDTPVVFLENVFNGEVLEHGDDIAPYQRAFDRMWELARRDRSSVELLKRVADELG